jgi:hypothetical protein
LNGHSFDPSKVSKEQTLCSRAQLLGCFLHTTCNGNLAEATKAWDKFAKQQKKTIGAALLNNMNSPKSSKQPDG